MNILINGFGSIGRRRAEIIASYCKDIAIYISDVNLPSRLPTFVEGVFDGLDSALCSNVKIDRVFECTPPRFHFLDALTCISLGIPIFIEKPTAIRLAEVNEILKYSKKYKTPFMCASNLFFTPTYKKIKEFLKDHSPLYISYYFGYDLKKWSKDREKKKELVVGVLRDCSQDIRLILSLLDSNSLPILLSALFHERLNCECSVDFSLIHGPVQNRLLNMPKAGFKQVHTTVDKAHRVAFVHLDYFTKKQVRKVCILRDDYEYKEFDFVANIKDYNHDWGYVGDTLYFLKNHDFSDYAIGYEFAVIEKLEKRIKLEEVVKNEYGLQESPYNWHNSTSENEF